MKNAKNQMIPRKIGKEIKGKIYRDIGEDGKSILYYEDKKSGLLFREVLEQDVDLVWKLRKNMGNSIIIEAEEKGTGRKVYQRASDILPKESKKEVLQKIRKINPESGDFALMVFNIKTSSFICLIDIETEEESDFKEGIVDFVFVENRMIRKQYAKLVKKRFNEICRETYLFQNGCKEIFWNGNGYSFITLP